MTAFQIQGKQVTLPMEIREATAATASFLVSAQAATRVIGYSGLEVLRPVPGKTVCTLAFVNYLDGDLGRYHEFAVAYLVKPPAGKPGRYGVFIHWLPVDQPFTLEAGRTIWGFPKLPTEITIAGDGHGNERCTVYDDGTLVAGLSVRGGISAPAAGGDVAVDAYTCLDGTLRRTSWSMDGGRAHPARRCRPAPRRASGGRGTARHRPAQDAGGRRQHRPVADELRPGRSGLIRSCAKLDTRLDYCL